MKLRGLTLMSVNSCCDKNLNRFRKFLRVFIIETFLVHSEHNSSVVADLLCICLTDKHAFIISSTSLHHKKCFHAISEKRQTTEESLQSCGHLPGRGWTLDGTGHEYSWKTGFSEAESIPETHGVMFVL